MSAARQGPLLRIVGSCEGCRWHFETEYDDNADDVRQCLHGAVPRTIDDAGKATPAWCPELPEIARRALAETAERGGRIPEIARAAVLLFGTGNPGRAVALAQTALQGDLGRSLSDGEIEAVAAAVAGELGR